MKISRLLSTRNNDEYLNVFDYERRIMFVIYFLLLLITHGTGVKILGVFPHFGECHFEIFNSLMLGLVHRGHSVTVLSKFKNTSPVKNYTTIDPFWSSPMTNFGEDIKLSNPHVGGFQLFSLLMEAADLTCAAIWKSPNMNLLLKSNQKFDLIIIDTFNSDCMLGLSYHYKVPHILFSSHAMMPWLYDRFGYPSNLAITSNIFGSYSIEMSFLQRFHNLVIFNTLKSLYYLYSDLSTDRLLKEQFGNQIPSVTELKKEAALIFVNLHYSMTGARPQLPAVVDIAGIHIKPPKPLDLNLRLFLNTAQHEVIFVNYGPLMQAFTLSSKKRKALLKTFGSLKQRVLWKWDNESIPDQPQNVMIRRWLPHRDVLANKNVRLLMSNGDLHDVIDAVHCGVPAIVTPLYGDHFVNSEMLRVKGVGLELKFEDIKAKKVFNAIKEALQPRYANNAKKLTQSFIDRPMSPLETAVWWVEHVAKHGGDHLRSPVRDMPVYQYFLLDVISFLIAASAVVMFIIIRIIRKLLRIKAALKKYYKR